jgi:hypothetical protein
MVIRIRRPLKHNIGNGRFKSTLYKFTGKCFNYVWLLSRKLAFLWKYFRFPKWVEEKERKAGRSIPPPINRVPKVAEYNPLKGVSVGGLESVGSILKGIIPLKGGASPI